jgi:hypothetical protein
MLHIGDFAAAGELLDKGATLMARLITAEPPNKWNIRGFGQAQFAVEGYISARCLHGFFTTGTLLPRSEFADLDDTE